MAIRSMTFRKAAVAVIFAITAIGGWAVVTGRASYVVTSGISMNPVYYQDDLVFVGLCHADTPSAALIGRR